MCGRRTKDLINIYIMITNCYTFDEEIYIFFNDQYIWMANAKCQHSYSPNSHSSTQTGLTKWLVTARLIPSDVDATFFWYPQRNESVCKCICYHQYIKCHVEMNFQQNDPIIPIVYFSILKSAVVHFIEIQSTSKSAQIRTHSNIALGNAI